MKLSRWLTTVHQLSKPIFHVWRFYHPSWNSRLSPCVLLCFLLFFVLIFLAAKNRLVCSLAMPVWICTRVSFATPMGNTSGLYDPDAGVLVFLWALCSFPQHWKTEHVRPSGLLTRKHLLYPNIRELRRITYSIRNKMGIRRGKWEWKSKRQVE